MTKISFIGAGNMNAAIISGLVHSGTNPQNIMVTNPSPEKREALAQKLNIQQTKDNITAANFADVIVLGVKPHLIKEVCRQISEHVDVSDKCFISIAAGTTVAQIKAALNNQGSVIRTMPNTPSQLGLGVTGLFACAKTTANQKAIAQTLLQAVGDAIWLESEEQIDKITAISGSGPAYFFLFMEAMEAKAKAFGFSPEQSRLLVQQTALGAATMVKENNVSIGKLRENVTSKGGTTQAALTSFIDNDIEALVDNAMTAAFDRAQEMGKNNT